MAAHARLKNDLAEDEKYHNLMSWLNINNEKNYQLHIFSRRLNKKILNFLPKGYFILSVGCVGFVCGIFCSFPKVVRILTHHCIKMQHLYAW